MALKTFLLATICTLLPATFVYANDALPDVREQKSISYLQGGIGEGELEAMALVQKDYSLHITHADSKGHYVGEVRLTVTDGRRQQLLDVTGGPVFYIKLPKGRYVIETTMYGEIKRKTVSISGTAPQTLRFIWPADDTNSTDY